MYFRECFELDFAQIFIFYFLFVGKDKTQASCLHSLCKCGIKISGHVPLQVKGENTYNISPRVNKFKYRFEVVNSK